MSLTLGEKLRQAREERGFTLSDVAEQTRISSQYLESIENDDYRTLPGGIFNKGFVKSYAKFVGLNEQEALADYSRLLEEFEVTEAEDQKLYKPEVLTDDRSNSSMAPTLILAMVILAAMTGGILFLVNYLRKPSEPTVAGNIRKPAANSNPEAVPDRDQTPSSVPAMSAVKVEFKALTEPVSLSATSDGKLSSNIVIPGTTATFEPKESLKLSYSKSLASAVQLSINGKPISLPATPLNPRRNAIEFEINGDNLSQIWSNASITTDVPSANPDANSVPATNTTVPVATPVRPAATPVPRPAANSANAANAVRPTPDRKPKEPVSTPSPRP